jgi:hypothetical protein
MKDYSFQGKIYLGMRDAASGQPQALQWVGDADQLQVKLSTTTDERQESWSGQRLTSVRLVTAKKAELSLQLNEFSPLNLGLALYGNTINVTTGTVTAEALPANLAAGDTVALDNRDVSAVAITDSTPTTPKTLVEGTDYNVVSAASGLIEILNIGTYVQPFLAAYSYAAAVQIPMFQTAVPERYLVLDGTNTVDGSTVKVRLFRCVFDPASQLDLISSKLSQFALAGSVLFDQVNYANSNMGGFGRIELAGVTP